ncbi:enoyl-CoA hydratase [Nocardioides aromaticivorans]|uniref:Enoyl-CoA hydratase n=1 Tax=Nocardioides aromaticivorans TaxID=200618 RepID=A0ABX7PG34_9ACTN|nr:enoyl-CoA hydratase-related protein [Nocardioides aromaticivorans]QSR24845.1 enoyl-CoA hydratase [Nocardioides aromaticivorans]
MSTPAVLVDRVDDVLTITLNRPERRNALNPQLLDDFDAAFAAVDDEVRVVVLQGAGKAFSSGHDLSWNPEEELDDPTDEAALAAITERLHEITRRIRGCPVPVVARVHGYAVGGGAEIALSADLVVASDTATFRFTETAVGLVVTNGFTALLPRTAGPVVAKEIIMLGEPFGGVQAKAWGLVNRVVPDAGLDAEVARIVGILREKSPHALLLAKSLLDQAWEGSAEEVMRRETLASVRACLHPDVREAAAAFSEKRAPRFSPVAPAGAR